MKNTITNPKSKIEEFKKQFETLQQDCTQGEHRTSENGSGDGDVTEKGQLSHASMDRPLLVVVQLPPALAQQQRRLTLRSLQMPPCANGRRVETERDAWGWKRHALYVLSWKSTLPRHDPVQTADSSRWRRG